MDKEPEKFSEGNYETRDEKNIFNENECGNSSHLRSNDVCSSIFSFYLLKQHDTP